MRPFFGRFSHGFFLATFLNIHLCFSGLLLGLEELMPVFSLSALFHKSKSI